MKAGLEGLEQGRYAEAERSLQAAVAEAERLGPSNRHLATSQFTLAGLYLDQRRIWEAYVLAMSAVMTSLQVFGEHHPGRCQVE
jgi:hypothetical protein